MSALQKRPKTRLASLQTGSQWSSKVSVALAVSFVSGLATFSLAGGAAAQTFRYEQEDGVREWNHCRT